MADGPTYDPLVVTNRARVEWDFTRNKNNWPGPAEAPFLWITFLAWATLVHRGDYPETVDGKPSFKRFRDVDCLYIEKKADEADEADPTREAPAEAVASG